MTRAAIKDILWELNSKNGGVLQSCIFTVTKGKFYEKRNGIYTMFVQLDVETLNKMLETDITEDERIDVTAIRILKEYKRAFEELAK